MFLHVKIVDFQQTTMDELIIHENITHFDSIDVTVIEAAVDEIVDLKICKRKNVENCNVKKMKYRLYD